MKILHVITTVNRGGAENHLADLTTIQRARGDVVVIAYLKGEGYWVRPLEERGVRVVPLGLAAYSDPRPVLGLRKIIRSFQPDLVHAHLPPAELYARLALIGRRVPLVISKHNDEPFYPGPFARPMGKLVATRASRIITISNAVGRYFYKELPDMKDRIKTIHYGIDVARYEAVDPEDIQRLRREWDVQGADRIIGTVARLVPQKALHVLLAGFSRYVTRSRLDTRLVIVGRGPLEQSLRQTAASLGIAEKVVWAGFREDVPTVMRSFDTFALTSIYEGFGLVLLEAMASSVPVVACSVSAIPEIVQHDRTGLLCAPGDAEALAQALFQLENADARSAMGRRGRERAVSEFTIPRMVDATYRIYDEVLAGAAA